MSARKSTQPARSKSTVRSRDIPRAFDQGLSLEELGAALAGKINSGDDPYMAAAGAAAADTETMAQTSDALSPSDEPELADPDQRVEINPRSILEAMLFVGSPVGEPLTARQVASMMRGVRAAEIDNLVRELNETYERRNCPYTIISEGSGYRLRLRPCHARLAEQFFGKSRQARLSQAAIEVLSAVAYRGPLTSEEIGRLRGTPSGHIVTQLVRRQLLRLERDADKPRRVRYLTTDRFLELFGLSSLDDLPKSFESLEG